MEKICVLTTLALLGGVCVNKVRSSLGPTPMEYHFYEEISEILWEKYTLPIKITSPVVITPTEREKAPTWLFFNNVNYIYDDQDLHTSVVTSLCEFMFFLLFILRV